MSTHERRHVPSHVPFQQRHMTAHVTFFNMARPLWPNLSIAIAQGYVVSTRRRSDNLQCVKEIHELVIRKVSAHFQHGAALQPEYIECNGPRLCPYTQTQWQSAIWKRDSWIICLTCACNGCNQIYVWMSTIDKRWIPTLTTIQEYGYQLTDDIDQYQLYYFKIILFFVTILCLPPIGWVVSLW